VSDLFDGAIKMQCTCLRIPINANGIINWWM